MQKRLLSLVDQLLLFRKADSGADELKLSQFNLAELCREVFLCFTHQAKTKHIALKFLCENDDIQIYADREKIEIVLFNLLANAMKFTSNNGHIALELAINASSVYIEVTDNGCGIPETAGDKLFNKFYQEYSGVISKGGLGIGLYLVKSYIEAHEGHITYESQINKGTTFKIQLPVGKVCYDSAAMTKEQVGSSVFF